MSAVNSILKGSFLSLHLFSYLHTLTSTYMKKRPYDVIISLTSVVQKFGLLSLWLF